MMFHSHLKKYRTFSEIFVWSFLSLVLFSCQPSPKELPISSSNDALVDSLLQSAFDYYDQSDFVHAQIFFDSASNQITKTTDTTLQIKLLVNKTELLKHYGNYDACLKNYYEAAKLSKLSSDSFWLALTYYNLASVYFYMDNWSQASKFNKEARILFQQLNAKLRLAHSYTLAASISRKTESLQAAEESINSALNYYQQQKDSIHISIALTNLANIYSNKNQLSEALSLYKESAQITNSINKPFSLSLALGNISDLYFDLNQLDSFKFYLDSSMAIATRINAKETIVYNYQRYLNFFFYKKNIDSIAYYTHHLLQEKTNLLKLESKEVVVDLEQQHQNELELIRSKKNLVIANRDKELAKQASMQNLFFLIFALIIASIIITTIYLLYQKQKRIRQQEFVLHQNERQLLEAQQKLSTLKLKTQAIEKEKLTIELRSKKEELLSFSLNLKEKNSFIKELQELIESLKPNRPPIPSVIKKLHLLLQNNSSIQQMQVDEQIENINSVFFRNLKNDFPKLNNDDCRLAALLLLDLSSKEIANLINIEPKSVDMKRYRLKKKLNLSNKDDLKTFLKSITKQ